MLYTCPDGHVTEFNESQYGTRCAVQVDGQACGEYVDPVEDATAAGRGQTDGAARAAGHGTHAHCFKTHGLSCQGH